MAIVKWQPIELSKLSLVAQSTSRPGSASVDLDTQPAASFAKHHLSKESDFSAAVSGELYG